MRKRTKKERRERYMQARARYEAKRHTKKWKNRKKRKAIRKIKKIRQAKKLPTSIIAPSNFSLIENAEEVLEYFKKANKLLCKGENVELDVSNVKQLTPPTLLLLVASINDHDFTQESIVSGNAPKKPELLKLFTESGFYDHVKTNGKFKSSKENLLNKQVDKIVVSEIVKEASIIGIKHVFNRETPFEPLYEVLLECMSNTNHHADLKHKGKCRWWLYTYNIPNKKITSYSFMDLGVGIFKSAVVKNYLKKYTKGTFLYPNIKLVDDLLSGKIQSRIEKDNEIRGKGIPQIVNNSKRREFKSFYIITNDVIIDLKTGNRKQLKNGLRGTFFYWEIQN
ncbi:hypothetical protein M0Q50_00105 [bacterium]|jgi:hypothetical protein|nr:hypothetical protein [bacterium]